MQSPGCSFCTVLPEAPCSKQARLLGSIATLSLKVCICSSDCLGYQNQQPQNLPSGVLKWRWKTMSFLQWQQDSKEMYFNIRKTSSEAFLDVEQYFVPLSAPRMPFCTLNKYLAWDADERYCFT